MDYEVSLLPTKAEYREFARQNQIAREGTSLTSERKAGRETEEGNYFVYCLCENGKTVRYIGITTQRPARRLSQHYSDASRKRSNHKTNWIRHCLAEGTPIGIKIVKTGISKTKAENFEIKLVKFFKTSFRLVNSHSGGATGYVGLSPESKVKHSMSGKLRFQRDVGSGKRLSIAGNRKKARLRIERANAADQKIIEEYEADLNIGRNGEDKA